jgi:hypothetical protein
MGALRVVTIALILTLVVRVRVMIVVSVIFQTRNIMTKLLTVGVMDLKGRRRNHLADGHVGDQKRLEEPTASHGF